MRARHLTGGRCCSRRACCWAPPGCRRSRRPTRLSCPRRPAAPSTASRGSSRPTCRPRWATPWWSTTGGAAGKIGVQAALRAPRDGHTLIAVSPSIASVNPVVDKAPGYDPLKDFDALGIAAPSTPACWRCAPTCRWPTWPGWCLREGPSGRAHLRLLRHRHQPAPAKRGAAAHARHRRRGTSLQGRGPGDGRAGGRRGGPDALRHRAHRPARAERPRPGPGRHILIEPLGCCRRCLALRRPASMPLAHLHLPLLGRHRAAHRHAGRRAAGGAAGLATRWPAEARESLTAQGFEPGRATPRRCSAPSPARSGATASAARERPHLARLILHLFLFFPCHRRP
jgi:hypothetical protein